MIVRSNVPSFIVCRRIITLYDLHNRFHRRQALSSLRNSVLDQGSHAGCPGRSSDFVFRRPTAYKFAQLIVHLQQLMDRQASLEARLPALLAATPREPLPVGRQSVEAPQFLHGFGAWGLRDRAKETIP